MKKLLIILTLLLPSLAFAQLNISQGGTGTTTFPANWFVVGSNSIRLKATGTPFFNAFSFLIATGTSATTTNLFSTTASTTNLFYTTGRGGNLTLNGSSTIQNITMGNSTSTGATTTSFSSATICLAGDCRTVWPASGGGSGSQPFTIQSYGMSTSTTIGFLAGLFGTGSSTLENFNFTTATGTSATTTSFFSTTASSTNLFSTLSNLGVIISGLINGQTISSAANLTGSLVVGTTLTATGGLTSLSNLQVSGSSTVRDITMGNATSTSGTSTNLNISNNASTTNLYVSSAGGGGTGCATFSATGLISSTGAACGGGSGAFPFTPTTNYGVAVNATTGIVWFQNGMQASTTSQILYASTTALSASGGLFVSPAGNGVGFRVNSVGALVIGGDTLPLSTSDSDGNTIFSVNGNRQNATAAVAVGPTTFRMLVDQANSRFLFTGGGILVTASSTIGGLTVTTGTTTSATSTNLSVSKNASSTNLYVSSSGGGVGGCATFGVDGLISSTGSACGGSGGGGNSKWATSTTNALAISPTNAIYVAIGTTTPQYPLTIASSTSAQLALGSGLAGIPQWVMRTEPNGDLDFATTTVAGNATTSTSAVKYVLNGKPGFGIGTTTAGQSATLAVFAPNATDFPNQFAVASSSGGTSLLVNNNGQIFAPNTAASGANQTGYWCYDTQGQLIRDTTVCLISALKFKENIKPLMLGLNEVMKMTPVTYFNKDKSFGARENVGFIADWSESIVPDLVTYDNQSQIHGFNYEQYTAVLTKAIQQVWTKITNHEDRITKLEKENAELKARLQVLENKIK